MPNEGEPRERKWIRITAVVPADLYPVWQAVIDKLESEGITHPTEQVRNGIALEICAAEFISGP